MSDDLENKLKEKLSSGLQQAKSNVVQFPSQSITGDGNTQIGNNQNVNQTIHGNKNLQIAGDYKVETKTIKQELPLPPNCIGANVALKKRINDLFNTIKKEQKKYHGKSYNPKAIHGQLAHKFGVPPKEWKQVLTLDEIFADEVITFLQGILDNTVGGRIHKAAKKPGYQHNHGHCFGKEKEYVLHLDWTEKQRKDQMMLVMGCSSRKELSLAQFNQWVVYLGRQCDALYGE